MVGAHGIPPRPTTLTTDSGKAPYLSQRKHPPIIHPTKELTLPLCGAHIFWPTKLSCTDVGK